MASGLMKDAFGHHTWATLELIDVCESLNRVAVKPHRARDVRLGPRHLSAPRWGRRVLPKRPRAQRAAPIDETSIGLAELRAAVEHQGTTWAWLAASNFDVEGVLEERDDDGYVRRAPVSIRLAQALHHGTDHRSQICTALSALGVTPPDIDVWQFGLRAGSVVELFPPHAD